MMNIIYTLRIQKEDEILEVLENYSNNAIYM